MKVVKIEFPIKLSQIDDIENDNLDVFVELEDGFTYVVVIFTPKNYYWYMEKENTNHYCGAPAIIVKKLTEEIIREAINEYAKDDAYWLKYYHLSGILDIKMMNRYIMEQLTDRNEIDKLWTVVPFKK